MSDKETPLDFSLRNVRKAFDLNKEEAIDLYIEGLQKLKESIIDERFPPGEATRYSVSCVGYWNTGDRHTWWSQWRFYPVEAWNDYNAHVANEPDATHKPKLLFLEI